MNQRSPYYEWKKVYALLSLLSDAIAALDVSGNARRGVLILDQFPSLTTQAIQLIFKLSEQQGYLLEMRMETEQKQGS
jgi:hypothetical protein